MDADMHANLPETTNSAYQLFVNIITLNNLSFSFHVA